MMAICMSLVSGQVGTYRRRKRFNQEPWPRSFRKLDDNFGVNLSDRRNGSYLAENSIRRSLWEQTLELCCHQYYAVYCVFLRQVRRVLCVNGLRETPNCKENNVRNSFYARNLLSFAP